jgi:hypothetical protein
MHDRCTQVWHAYLAENQFPILLKRMDEELIKNANQLNQFKKSINCHGQNPGKNT